MVFGDQSREWSYEYGELRCAPVLSGFQLTIHTKVRVEDILVRCFFMGRKFDLYLIFFQR